MTPAPPPTARWSGRTKFLVALFVVPVVFVVGVLAVLAYVYRPRGKAIATLNLVPPPATSANVDAAAGDRLLFRLDLVIDARPASGKTKEERRRADTFAAGALGASTVTIQTSTGGPGRTTTCTAYDGMSFTTSLSEDGTYVMEGVRIACAVPIEVTGRHVVTAAVDWRSDLRVRSAKLEVRRDSP